MDEQFSGIHSNPDIIIATPGRLLHLVVEMEMSLTTVEYVVFDEADQYVDPPSICPSQRSIEMHVCNPHPSPPPFHPRRLYELGFAEQLREILSRLPHGRQTLLFSATLPKLLVEFARAGLTNPTLVRLDVENKLSDQLWLVLALSGLFRDHALE